MSSAFFLSSAQTGNGRCASTPKSRRSNLKPGMRCGRCRVAGVPRDNPQVAEGLDYLLNRQQAFGGWFDPLQSFENFRTPFRETQFAVLALSSYYPGPDKNKGWNSPAPASLSKDPGSAAGRIRSRVGRRIARATSADRTAATRSNDALIRRDSRGSPGPSGRSFFNCRR